MTKILAFLLALSAPAVAPAVTASCAAEPLEARAAQVRALFRENPPGIADLFTSEFLAQVPAPQVAATAEDLFRRYGSCVDLKETARTDGEHATFDLFFEKGYRVPMSLVLESTPPHRIAGLRLGNPVRLADHLADIASEIDALGGITSFRVIRVDDGRVFAEVRPDKVTAIGSAFKLFVLGTLVGQIENGRHRWDEVVRIDPKFISLPTGVLQGWPAGSPLTLHTLAALAISISDNTAADQLLALVGREEVEQSLRTLGVAHPEPNRPFLSTEEAFRLKWGPDRRAAADFGTRDEAGRRKLIAELDASVPISSLTPRLFSTTSIESVEWFASAADLCRTMMTLRNDSSKDAEIARAILAINPGLPISRTTWSYVGFKGGSEPGAIDLTYLLEAKDGEWYALSAAWNDPAKNLDEPKFEAIVQRAIELLPEATR